MSFCQMTANENAAQRSAPEAGLTSPPWPLLNPWGRADLAPRAGAAFLFAPTTNETIPSASAHPYLQEKIWALDMFWMLQKICSPFFSLKSILECIYHLGWIFVNSFLYIYHTHGSSSRVPSLQSVCHLHFLTETIPSHLTGLHSLSHYIRYIFFATNKVATISYVYLKYGIYYLDTVPHSSLKEKKKIKCKIKSHHVGLHSVHKVIHLHNVSHALWHNWLKFH